MGYRIINGQAYPVGNFQALTTDKKVQNNISKDAQSFKDILNSAIKEEKGYTLSKHAADRLQQINFTPSDMKAIEKGFKMAEDKGAKNSVMIYKDVALIASIENKTIITAVEKERAKENVFTNVDSVVIL